MRAPRGRVGDNSTPHSPASPSLPPSLPVEAWATETTIVLSGDGSAAQGQAGWGVTVVNPFSGAALDYCGPFVGSPSSAFEGIRSTNNAGELLAMLFALRWIHAYVQQAPDPDGHGDWNGTFVIEYDSTYAYAVTTKLQRPASNGKLVVANRRAHELVRHCVVFRKAVAHTGLALNERADELAKCGASGICMGIGAAGDPYPLAVASS